MNNRINVLTCVNFTELFVSPHYVIMGAFPVGSQTIESMSGFCPFPPWFKPRKKKIVLPCIAVQHKCIGLPLKKVTEPQQGKGGL